MNDSQHPSIGLEVSSLPTPSLVVDLDAFEANCSVLAGHMARRGLDWRPHIKAHKSPLLAQKMVEAGAIGVTCAKVGEAEVMAAGDIDQILIANQPSTEQAWLRLAELQESAWAAATIDSPEHLELAKAAAHSAGHSIPLLIEVDIGMSRAGVRSTEDAVVLAERIVASGLPFAGVMGYEGHLLTISSTDEKTGAINEAVSRVVKAAEAIRDSGIEVDIVSCGGTGSFEITSQIDGVTEIQAGGGCLMDRFYREMCGVDLTNALFAVAAVGSRPTEREAILDAGWKALPDKIMKPICVDIPGSEVSQLYAEHMRLDLPDGSDPQIGDRLKFIPGYSDATTVLHNEFLGVREGVVVDVIPLAARGALQ